MNYIKKHGEALLYVLPAALIIAVFFISSILYTLVVSFTDWDGLTRSHWVGLKNYVEVFSDVTYITSLKNTFMWVGLSLILPVGLGLLLSILLQQIKGQRLFKNLFYLPYAMSLTVVGVIWIFLFSSSGINYLLTHMGLESWTRDWLQTPHYNTVAMLIASLWQGTGTNMLLFLVGLGSLPKDPFEAAAIDGANRFQIFWRITLPLLNPVTIVVLGLALVNSFKTFDIIWVMTQGGPYRSSETLAVTMYRETFMLFHFGQGAAISILLTILTVVASWFYLRKTIVEE
ncbi:carbohydrate ABC transporter permease [Paenibacillus sp. OV219]|uniref:carbohydrate ABC transporter permease n=1 Tax=Paenibacillus sp. OV219 TaxID=1884377 RepID=UPI0008CA0963|nr:sugar ABC transporter permease [Paenibacillus sp. OV219]SEO89015.1 carbohydrate ABC transporter membrane protein 1, CUT1 family [Paenibacillus sp. OV219]